ncbi:hypothetical protein BSKO_07677 [Bryopsis sp. KO-2023]|nr:hypothetical protein BSKO_07677 [Bryopsis sp. KO-2023]
MGTKRDKRRKRKGHVATGAKKTEEKTVKNLDKQSRRIEQKLKEDEEDIDAILAQIKLDEAKKTEVKIEDDCAAPSPRVHASYTPIQLEPQRVPMTVVFGGEYEDLATGKVLMYNDLYKYNTDKDRWTKISSPNSPPPRSAHQMVAHRGFLYMFGGEFTSPKQDRFHHYRDLWRFDLTANEWDKLPVKGGPVGRSGHRMAVHKDKIVLFGGFTDTGLEKVRYYNDVWVFDLSSLQWSSVGKADGFAPSPRGGSRVTVFEDRFYVYGGYSKVADDEDGDLEHGKVQDDMWILDLKTYKWEKVKKAGMAPSARSGCCWAVHKRRTILFGGVTDNEAKGGETLVSEFFNELYQFNFDSRKWFPVAIRLPKGSKQADSDDSISAMESAGLHKAATLIQSRYRGYVVRKAYKLYKIGGVVSEVLYSPATYGVDLSSVNLPKPKGRINGGMVVLKNTLWLFGGMVEVLDKEISLDDIWCFDLNKYDGWKCVRENSAGEDAFKEERDALGSERDSSGDSSGESESDPEK